MKRLLKDGFLGMLWGIAANYLLAIAASYLLKLGYFMPYPATLPEQVGGELNAVLISVSLCAIIGLGGGLAFGLTRMKAYNSLKRGLGASVSVFVSILPALLLVMHAIQRRIKRARLQLSINKRVRIMAEFSAQTYKPAGADHSCTEKRQFRVNQPELPL